MLQAIRQLLGMGKPNALTRSADGRTWDLEEEDIPRYPPFAKGLPVAPLDRILLTQRELIQSVQMALGMPQQEFERLVIPVLTRYAGFVHLMPASETHHHRGAGGLFRHGLEVAFWTTRSSGSMMFSMEGSPLERRNNEPRWRLAACFAGLMHDVGKPLSDVMVSDRDGRATWNPFGESLFDWATRHGIDRYFLRWRDQRHKRHEKFSLLMVDRLLPKATREYLAEAGPQVIESMLEAISGVGANQPITRLVLLADRESVQRDLREHRLNVDEYSYGVPVERYIFDALRRLVGSGKWKINVPGAKVWVLKHGVFVIWKPVQDITEMLAKDKTPGVPRDADTLADILIERGFAHSRAVSENGERAQYRYWQVLPDALKEHGVTEPLLMLRLDSVDLIITGEPPAPVSGSVVGLADLDAVEAANGPSLEPADGALPASGNADTVAIPASLPAAAATVGGVRGAHLPAASLRPDVSDADKEDSGASQERDEVQRALEVEAAAAVTLGGIGMDGIGLFAEAEVAATETASPQGPVPQAAGVDDPKPEDLADAAQHVPTADLTRPGARKEATTPAVEVRPMDVNGADQLGLQGAEGLSPVSGAVPPDHTSKKSKAKLRKKSSASKPEPAARTDSEGARADYAASPAEAARAKTPPPAQQELVGEMGTLGLSALASKTAQGAAMERAGGNQSSALQALLAIDIGLGRGPEEQIQFVDLEAPEDEPVNARVDMSRPGRSAALASRSHDRASAKIPSVLPAHGQPITANAPAVQTPARPRTAQSAGSAGPVPPEPGPTARDALRECLRAYGGTVMATLGRGIGPLLDRTAVLGQVLYFEGAHLCILYPEGIQSLVGADQDIGPVVAELESAGAIVPTESFPKRIVWRFDGVKVLVLSAEISAAAKNAFNEAAGETSASSDSRHKATREKSDSLSKPAYQAPMADMNRKRKPAANPGNSQHPERNPSPPPHRILEALTAESEIARPVQRMAKRKTDEPDGEEEDSANAIARQLREMILNGNGRWLASPVSKDEHGSHVDVRSLDLIKNELPSFNIHLFKFTSSRRRLKIIANRIYAKE